MFQILIVEDDKELSQLFQKVLEKMCIRDRSGGGQILVCVAGRGFYQEEGRDAVEMRPGDCINIPVDVKHWHGAAPDEWFSHLAIEAPGVDCSNEWCEAVSEKEMCIRDRFISIHNRHHNIRNDQINIFLIQYF